RAVFERPAHPYTAELVAARAALSAPERDVPRGTSAIDAGRVALPRTFVAGCAYAPRCPLARARCGEAPPPLAELPGTPERRSACFFASEVSP
ncbi:MAG: oligopeptide ABC transporter ATP-binding protein OppD, partial [Planctomycetes bacterium]|nr:oligopeptide ABC transporter ATP-binding protein OppD [Planctomycetota bacterium]